MNIYILKSILIGTLFFSATTVFADVTYSYTGKNLNHHYAGSGNSPINITLTFSDNGLSLLDWSLSQEQVGTISMLDTEGLLGSPFQPIINLATNSAGQVTYWHVSAVTLYDLQGLRWVNQQIESFVSGYSYGMTYPDHIYEAAVHEKPPVNGVFGYSHLFFADNTLPGTWSSNGSLNNLFYHYPDSVPVPEPETYAMMLCGLGLIGFIVRRRNNNKPNLRL